MWKTPSVSEIFRRIPRALFVLIALSGVTALIESLAGAQGRERVFDLTAVFLERPVWMVLFGVWFLFLSKKLRGSTWVSAIDQALLWSPLLLVAPCLNSLVAWFGFETLVPPFVNVLEVPVSLLTFGWLPRPIASAGILILVLGVAVGLFIEGWRLKRSVKSVLAVVLLWLVGGLGLLLLPSFIAWSIVSVDVSPLNAGPNVLARSWVALAQEGYWWRSVVDRFPGIVEGEAYASVRLVQLVLVWLVGIGTAIVLVSRQLTTPIRSLFQQLKPVRGLSFLGAAFFGLWIGHLFGGVFMTRIIDGFALLLFLTALIAVWCVTSLRTNLSKPEEGIVPTHPWLLPSCSMVAGVSAWLLGWPVLFPLLSFVLLQEALHSPFTRWKERWFAGGILAFSFVSIVAAGIFFSLRTAAIPLLPMRIWLMIGVFYLLQALPKAFRWSPTLLGWLTEHLRFPPRMVIPIVLALSYLLVPLISGWVVVWWIASPFAVVALLPLLGNGRWDDRKIVGWQTAFILIAFLLLTVQPPR